MKRRTKKTREPGSLHRMVSLRSKSLMSLKAWDRYRKRAIKDRSLQLEQTAINNICWTRGYLRGLEDAQQANDPSSPTRP